MKKMLALLFTLGLVLSLAGGAQAAPHPDIAFCTGEPNGVFNSLGEAMIKVMKEDFAQRKLVIVTTSGASVNCQLVGVGNRELGFAHGDTLYFAAKGGDRKAGFERPLPNLRVVASLYSNYVHMMAGKNSGIKSLAEMKGRKIAMGPAGSGTSITAGFLLQSLGFQSRDLTNTSYTPIAGNPGKIRSKSIDAAIVVQGLPSQASASTLAAGAVLLPVPPEAYQAMSDINKQYLYQPIPKGTYPGQDQDVPTIVINTYLITHAGVDNETIYKITKALFDHSADLAAGHPVGKEISLQKATQNLPVPLHPGAERFYKDKGILK
ncbi:MAG: TAXI family TRAP transporter solute-binding subunit [Desulfarculus sp.]|nr:TAXI family TRAP transporter solute-binding subunit [Desulfarculus sp.]